MRLFIKIKINNVYIKGKYSCPFVVFIWFTTILYIVAYIDSKLIDQLLDIILSLLIAVTFNINIIKVLNIK
jgi:hypothetical protein